MKKFIAKLYGAEVFADAECIKGRKSSGREDDNYYDHWMLIFDSKGVDRFSFHQDGMECIN